MTIRPKIEITILCLFIIGIGYVDYLQGFQLSLFPLYMVAVAVVSWNRKRPAVLVTSAVASLVIIHKTFGETFSHEILRYWEILSKIATLLLAGWATSTIKQVSTARDAANQQLREVVDELLQARKGLLLSNELLEKKVAERTHDLTMTIAKLEAEITERMRLAQELEAEAQERLRAEDELHQSELLLVQQSKMAAMGEMIGNIAHQWRQPLNMLNLIAQEMLICYKTGNFSEDYLVTVVGKTRETIMYMSRTIDDFRNFFRPDKEKMDFKAIESIRKTLSLVDYSFRQLGVVVEISTSGDPVINGFQNEFSQVILNILSNARDAFSRHTIDAPRITITVGTEAGKTVLSFVDNAGGIAEDIIHRIFDSYFTTKGEEGTGIGLCMSRKIIESMNGTLTARNIGDGAEFRIVI